MKGYPSQAKNLEDLLDIPEQFATTADKKRFLLLNDTDTVIPNNPVPSAPRILVIKSDTARLGMWMAPSSRHSTHYSLSLAKNIQESVFNVYEKTVGMR